MTENIGTAGTELQRMNGQVIDAETGEILPADETRRYDDAELVSASPWSYTETGRPVFESRSYDEHEGEWISKEQEGNVILWEMGAIAYSLVGLAAREKDAQGRVSSFAGVVKTSATAVYKAAGAYAVWVHLEDEGYTQVQALIKSLTFKHFRQAYEGILNRAETNALECGEWLERADDEGWSAAEMKRQIVAAQRAALDAALPEGVFCIIYADPPWEYDNSGLGGAANQHYSTMGHEEMCGEFAERLKPHVADDAALFMWATNPLLSEALEVMEAWGFTYKTNLVWVKNRATYGKLGFYVRGQHELLLIGVRGSMIPGEEARPHSVIDAPLGKHSAKPEGVYEVIEGMYPEAKPAARLELFARETREGWTPFGDEVGNG